MDMRNYLAEMEHAARTTIELVWTAHERMTAAETDLARLTAVTDDGYQRAEAFQQIEDPEDFMMGVGIHWDTYFGPDKERHHAAQDLLEVRATFDTQAFARAAQSASLIQYAKQGISLVHRGLDACPPGRDINGQSLATVIWMARNQALHWEEGRFSESVTTSFELLKAADLAFSDYSVRNMAFEIVSLLRWRDYVAYEADMLSLS